MIKNEENGNYRSYIKKDCSFFVQRVDPSIYDTTVYIGETGAMEKELYEKGFSNVKMINEINITDFLNSVVEFKSENENKKIIFIIDEKMNTFTKEDLVSLKSMLDISETIVFEDFMPPRGDLRVFEVPIINSVIKQHDSRKVNLFIKKYGKIKFDKINFYHFMLKDYLSINHFCGFNKDFFSSIKKLKELELLDNFNRIYLEESQPQNIMNGIKECFDYELNEAIYFKSIYKKRI